MPRYPARPALGLTDRPDILRLLPDEARPSLVSRRQVAMTAGFTADVDWCQHTTP